MEAVTTDREVKLQEIERDKNVEQGVMDVANITRERIAIDKTVALEEERINEVREVSAADRAKQVRVMQAEAQAQEQLVQEVKAAEAAETAARHRAAELTTTAQAQFDAASRQAEAKKLLADAVRVEQAAPGLAQVMVQEANASALEKTGVAEARVIEVKADANLKLGQNEARVLAERLGAQAEGETRLGQAKASAVGALGSAEASATRDRMNAEAEGLTAKFGAMDRMSADARSHEEYRMALETSLQQALASIEAGKEISRENAAVIAAALKNAKIDLVGGEGGMFEALTKALSLGKAMEGFTQKSPLFQSVLNRFGVNVQRENRPN